MDNEWWSVSPLLAQPKPRKRKRWSLHLDHPWAECVREDGAPLRLYVGTPWFVIIVGEPAQVWNPWTRRYTEMFFPIVLHPKVSDE